MKNPTTLYIRPNLYDLLRQAAQASGIDSTKPGWMVEVVTAALRLLITIKGTYDKP